MSDILTLLQATNQCLSAIDCFPSQRQHKPSLTLKHCTMFPKIHHLSLADQCQTNHVSSDDFPGCSMNGFSFMHYGMALCLVDIVPRHHMIIALSVDMKHQDCKQKSVTNSIIQYLTVPKYTI